MTPEELALTYTIGSERTQIDSVEAPAWMADLALSRWCVETGDRKTGLRACERLTASYAPGWIRLAASRNRVAYAPMLSELIADLAWARFEAPPHTLGWTRHNPTIAADPDTDGYLAIVRSSNWNHDDGDYRPIDADGHHRSENTVIGLDAELSMTWHARLDATIGQQRPAKFIVEGYEDLRLFRAGSRWMATASVRDRRGDGLARVVLLRLDLRPGRPRVVDERVLPSSAPRNEKNWVALPDSTDAILAVYGWNPLSVVSLARPEAPVATQPLLPMSESLRGGTPFVDVGEGLTLGVVHDISFGAAGRRTYLHRFVALDGQHRLAAISVPFGFRTIGIEYCAGLAVKDDLVTLSFGFEEREAWMVQAELDDVMALLRPVPTPAY